MFGLFKKKPESASTVQQLQPGRSQLVPRIKHVNFLRALQARGVPAAQQPAAQPLCGDLLVTYAFDLPDSFIMATPGLLEQAGIAANELTALAQENLKKAISQVQFYEKAGFKFAQTGNGLEATLLLLDTFWDHVQSEIGNPVAAMAPHRDWILMCDSTKPAVLQEMRAESQRQFDNAQDNHLLSKQVMLRGPQGWSLLAA